MNPDNVQVATERLGRIAIARSGDKGTAANIGVIARSEAIFVLLREQLTADRVADFFRPLGLSGVSRYELPNLGALNFVLQGGLGRVSRNDNQGKALGQAILELPVVVPVDLLPVE